jgi:antitoxin ParD1/3/4
MSNIERITITMPAEMAATVRAAVDAGAYASTSEVVREALRDWTDNRGVDRRALANLRAMIAEGDEGEDIPADIVFSQLHAIVEQAARKLA